MEKIDIKCKQFLNWIELGLLVTERDIMNMELWFKVWYREREEEEEARRRLSR